MNKIIKLSTLLVVFACSTLLSAQRISNVQYDINDFPGLQYNTKFPAYPLIPMGKQMPKMVDYHTAPVPASVVESRPFQVVPMQRVCAKKDPMSLPIAGYMAPEGALFTGIDSYGMIAWYGRAGVVGSWGKDVKTWKWRNISQTSEGSTYTYRNYTVNRIPEYDSLYRVDLEGNLIDSFQPSMKTNIDYVYAYNIPMQVVSNTLGADTFMMFSEPSERQDTLIGTGTTFAGCPCPLNSRDGMWPLTNAQMSTMSMGAFVGVLYDANIAKKTACYYFGSKPIEGNQMTKITSFYEKPMAPLYVKNITLAINAQKYFTNGQTGKHKREWFDYCRPTFDSLVMTIYDARTNDVIARSIALGTDSDALYKDPEIINDSTYGFYPWILTFKLEQLDSVYGDLLEEGVTLTDSFRVELSNIHAGQNFGIHAGLGDTLYLRNSVTLADGTEGIFWKVLEPFIMLNGMYTAFYDGDNDSTEQIDIRMEYLTDAYYGVYMKKSAQGVWTLPGFYSTSYPIDTFNNHFNCVVEAPEWAEINFSSDYFDDYGYVSFYLICDKESAVKPAEGDSIKITIGGKTLVYNIKTVTHPSTPVDNLAANAEASVCSLGDTWQVNYAKGYNQLNVFATNGQMVLSHDLTEAGQVVLSAKSFTQGEYLIRLTGDKQPTTLRVIK